jgi:hypothetical protein
MLIGYPAFPDGWLPLVVEAAKVTGSETPDQVVAAVKLAMLHIEQDRSSWLQGILADDDVWRLCSRVLTELGWARGEDGAWHRLAASGATP